MLESDADDWDRWGPPRLIAYCMSFVTLILDCASIADLL